MSYVCIPVHSQDMVSNFSVLLHIYTVHQHEQQIKPNIEKILNFGSTLIITGLRAGWGNQFLITAKKLGIIYTVNDYVGIQIRYLR